MLSHIVNVIVHAERKHAPDILIDCLIGFCNAGFWHKYNVIWFKRYGCNLLKIQIPQIGRIFTELDQVDLFPLCGIGEPVLVGRICCREGAVFFTNA